MDRRMMWEEGIPSRIHEEAKEKLMAKFAYIENEGEEEVKQLY